MQGMNLLKYSSVVALKACSFEVNKIASGEIQLFPATDFRANDGRPEALPAWVMNAVVAQALIAQFAKRANPMVLDYEHQTYLSADNGQPAMAAGWIDALRWIEPAEGVAGGLFASVRWTERAAAHIAAEEYKFISPVFTHDPKTGAVLRLLNAALTNNPAIDDMQAVSARLTANFLTKEQNIMELDELLERMRYWLNLPTLSTPQEVVAEMDKAIALIKADAGEAAAIAATSGGVFGLLAQRRSDLVLARSAVPSPAEFVPVATFDAVKSELVLLKSAQLESEVGGIVQTAVLAGKIQPAEVEWMSNLGKTSIELLKQRVASAPILAAPGTQTKGIAPVGEGVGELSTGELAMCRQMGLSQDDFKKTRAAGMVV
jgi:phage I-like protein